MRAASAGMITALQNKVGTFARLFRITRTDTTVLYFTDSDQPITFDSHVYRNDIPFEVSALKLSGIKDKSANVTVTVGMSSDGFNEDDIRSRRYLGATGECDVINYQAPADGVIKMFKGVFGGIQLDDPHNIAVIDIGEIAANFAPTVAFESYSPTCRASLGDARCGVDIEALKRTITVTGGTGLNINCTIGGATVVTDYFAFGFVKWATGNNAGLVTPIRANDTDTLFFSRLPVRTITNGDTGHAYPGCDKVITTCFNKFNNVVNNRSEPWVPSTLSINYRHTTVGVLRPGALIAG